MTQINDSQPHWLIVANPASGSGKVKKEWTAMERKLRENNIVFTIHFTKKAGDATRIVQNALTTEGVKNIIGLGGDGTCNEIINGIFKQQTIAPKDVKYTMFAAGTGNDWVKMHAIPSNLDDFIQILKGNKTTFQDIGTVVFKDKNGETQKHFFANAGGLGYDSFVVKSVESVKKRYLPKKFAYFLHIFKCLFAYKAAKTRIVFDGQTIEDKFYTINFGINKFSGAGMQMTPHAIKDDGLLGFTVITDIAWWKVIMYMRLLYVGNIAKAREASLFQVKNIRIESMGTPVYCETDGELVGCAPMDISVLQNALQVVIA